MSGTDWAEVGILDLVTIASGQVDPRLPQYRSLPLIAPDHIEPGTGRLLEVRTAAEQGAISGKYVVEPGDVIYSKIRPYLRKVHRATFCALCSADMYPLRPKPGVDGQFIVDTLLSDTFTNFAISSSMRSGIPKINRSELAEYRLRAPNAHEQARVGLSLAHCDALVASLERLIAKKRDIKQGMMQELLTGHTRLPAFTARWSPATSLAAVSSRASGFWGEAQPSGQAPCKVQVITAGDITPRGKIRGASTRFFTKEQFDKAKCRVDDLIITNSGNGLGKTAYINEPGMLVASNFVRIVRPLKGISGAFLSQLMQTPKARQVLDSNTATSAYPNLLPTFYSEQWFSLPSSFEEQVAVAGALHEVDAEIEALELRVEKLRRTKQGMMQELLTGRTRLPVEEVVA